MTITGPDERWTDLGRQACKVLAPYFVAVEHIGSTAVPGVAAPPLVIDLLAAAEELDDVNDERLQHFGWRMETSDTPDELHYRREDYDSTPYFLRVVQVETWPDRGERLFRDHLLTDPEARDRYAASKRELMDRCGPGEAYTRGKDALIRELTDAARAARGLPPVPVREQ